MESAYYSERTRPLYRGTQVVWYILGIVEALLAFRFLLRLFGANSSAGFTRFIYAMTDNLANPFRNVFGVTRVEGAAFEWGTLLAMAVYALIAWAIVKVFFMSKPVTTPEAARKLERHA